MVDDESRAIYTGLIRIEPEAGDVNAFQTNRTLKLSESAWAESVPNLEIEKQRREMQSRFSRRPH